MLLPQVRGSGVYRRKEKHRQIIPCRWLAFYIRGAVWSANYWPDGRLRHTTGPETGPYLSLGYPGMTTDFEYGDDRENWVVMMDCPELQYDPEGHCLFLAEEDGRIIRPLPDRVFVSSMEVPLLRRTFSEITSAYRSALPQELLRANFLLASLFPAFLKTEFSDENGPAESLRRLIDEDAKWEYPLSELCRRSGYSRDYLRRAFRIRYGITPGEYRSRRRLHLILHLIAYSSMSLKEIAYEVGMRHVTHLNAFLMHSCGKTPSEICRSYRRSLH